MTGEVHLFTDGGSRGNPGPAAVGWVITDASGEDLVSGADSIGEATNNVAEYRALIRGLQEATRFGSGPLVWSSDSEVVVRQMRREYRVREPTLRPLFDRATHLAEDFDTVTCRHVQRSHPRIQQADRALNAVLDGEVGEAQGRKRPIVLDRIYAMLRSDAPRFPPTVLYNENWLLRLVMDWIVDHGGLPERLPVSEGAQWFSEALLPSAFLARRRGDPLAESHTHADGVIGHFSIGGSGKGDLVLASEARQLSVLEGKVFSRLSPGVANARYFDQAARNVACVAEVLQRAAREPEQLDHLRFQVVAPEQQIAAGIFGDLVTQDSIRAKVERRVEAYAGDRDEWHQRWFLATLDRITVGIVSWEDIVAGVWELDPAFGQGLENFYQACLELN